MYGREPDWDAIANQRLYAYLDSCDPACEDCECSDCEYPDEVLNEAQDDYVACDCKCHNLPQEPDEYDDREDDRFREERDNYDQGDY